MRRLIWCFFLSVGVMTALASQVLAQADAQQAFQAAKAAFEAGSFTEARDLAEKASQTDTENPEVFLLLGRAHYQLGELDDAIKAWSRTLALAPEEPYAAKMLDALKAERADVDARIRLVEVLLGERLHEAARKQCAELMAEASLSAVQRAKIITIRAELLLSAGAKGGTAEAQRLVEELRALYPDEADPVQMTLLSGQVKLRLGGESTAEGVAALEKLVADHPNTPAAATARYELISYGRQAGADAEWADAMAQWIADNPGHPSVYEAKMGLITGYLEITRRSGKPAKDGGVSPTDEKALTMIAGLVKSLRPNEAKQLVDQALKHLQTHYANSGATAAAVKAAETLLGAPLPDASRLPVLRSLASFKTGIAMEQFNEQARRGRLPQGVPRGELPESLAAVVAVYDTIDEQYPAEPTWGDRAQLAASVRSYAPKVLPTAEFQGWKGPDAWALDLAFPVIRADADAAAAKTAVETVLGIIHDRNQVPKPGSRELAVGLSGELVDALSPANAAWSGAMSVRAELLAAQAKIQFDENLKEGRSGENEKLSDLQRQLLATFQKHVTEEAAHGPAALQQLGAHLAPWIAEGHWAVAEEAYTTLAKGLPEVSRRQAELAVVGLWIREATGEHQRLANAGLTVPRKIDPRLDKALQRCCQLQAGLDDEPAQLAKVRRVWGTIVGHYKSLEYYDVAEAAVKVKAEPAVEAAEEYAAFQLVQLKDEAARRELTQLLNEYGASERIALSPAFQETIAGWKQFVTSRPASPLALQAVERLFAVGQLFEQQGAHEVAAGVYDDLAQFGAAMEQLSLAAADAPSTTERAAFAAAQALDAHARKRLAEHLAEHTGDAPPPETISDEFTSAIDAYLVFVEADVEGPLASQAIQKIMAVALEYANVGAWAVADGVFARLQESDLDIRRPERLELSRALCYLGRAMPDHAREMLAALSASGLRESGTRPGETMLAGMPGLDSSGDALGAGGGGFGGMGGMRGAAGSQPMPAGGPQTRPAADPRGEAPAAAAPVAADQPVAATPQARRPQADRDAQLLAMIRNQEANRAARVAQLRENVAHYAVMVNGPAQQAEQEPQQGQQARNLQQAAPAPMLSEAELARQQEALAAAYDGFQRIRKDYPNTPTAQQARGEILLMVSHWRSVGQWQRAAELARRFLDDNPNDLEKPRIRLETARDWLAWASKPIQRKPSRQVMLAEVSGRFSRAREELDGIVAEFVKERAYRQQAQWNAANSFLTQARAIDAFSPTLARGQYVRAAKELQRVAGDHPDHPEIGKIPQLLWGIAQELESRAYFDEAIRVWSDLKIFYPMNNLAQQAALKIAQTYQQRLERPLRAAEAYQELNFARGGNDQSLQNSIFQIGSQLKDQKRWVEALHVLEMFVDGFPRHEQAGQALTTIGQIHQTNEAWEDAIAAYRRVIDEFEDGQCTYVEAYASDAEKVAEANRRIEVLKDLTRYQALVDEEGQRKAFDAQFQIARIVASQLSNRVKAIIEYRKVVSGWATSHLADDALYEVGSTYLALGETEKAREALLAVAEKYPASPLADDALLMVGKSFEDEADKLATVTRAESIERAKDIAQRFAYEQVQLGRRKQQEVAGKRIADLKKAGKAEQAEVEEAFQSANTALFNEANVRLFAQKAGQQVQTLTATQLADREDKINAALRKAVNAYTKTSEVAGADKADEALLQMATIYDQRLKDSVAAMATWLEIVRQFSGTTVAEDASWRIAQTYERQVEHAKAVEAYKAFLRNYRRSPNAGQAQFAVAENYEHLGEWVSAMDSYTNYLNNFPEGPLASKAKEQINWIKTYRL
ncbi:MAG: tetratricopeptide repeat protein [Planctomycetota bacterium]|jgi:tetratricopeptide (TPR) repeat protein